MFKRTYGRWGLNDGEGKPKIERLVGAKSTGSQGLRRAVEPGGGGGGGGGGDGWKVLPSARRLE
jgi:hypothetical protein